VHAVAVGVGREHALDLAGGQIVEQAAQGVMVAEVGATAPSRQ
jgi:hypothetical protein